MYELRDYQKEAVKAAVDFFRNTKKKTNGLLVLPTGSGKSLVIAAIADSLDAPVLIFQPSKEILEQNYAKMLAYQPYGVGIYSASFNRREVDRITFATIGSVKNHKEDFHAFKYVIVDEAHGVNSLGGMYKDFFEAVQCKILGLTATPYRLASTMNGSILKFLTRTQPRIFQEVLYVCQTGTLAQQGYLAPMNYYRMNIVDTSLLRVNSTGADYTDWSVRRLYKEIKFHDTLENTIVRLLNVGRQSILVFTRFVEEAEYAVGCLNHAGYHAAVVSADTPKRERAAILEDFKEGRINVVANVGILTTGFDFPALNTVVLARPTMSLALYYQMCGRAIRPYPGKTSWVVDMCGNFKRFGRVEGLFLREVKSGLWAVFQGNKQLTNVYLSK